jgi:cytosine/adenosine deaminase-related metal-dependent hydrolase
MSPYEALEIATRGGAEVLNRPDCGQLAIGKRADIAIWDVSGVESAGSWDKATLLLAGPTRVKHLFVEGRQIVRDEQVVTLDLPKVIERQNQLARTLRARLPG